MNLTKKQQQARDKICIPLDNLRSLDQVENRVDELKAVAGMFKIGKQLFTRFGPKVVKLVQDKDRRVFLDLKYHDIPNTVEGAAKSAADLEISIFNVHALGGKEMMEAAKSGLRKSDNSSANIIAVTILTSIDQNILNYELKIAGKTKEKVLQLSQLAAAADLSGVVCSAADLSWIKKELPDDFMFVTPGIVGPNSPESTDQKRTMTPTDAIKAGSSILVIGRGITAGETKEERIKAGKQILQNISEYI